MDSGRFVDEMTSYLEDWGPEDIHTVAPLLLSYRPTRLGQPPATLDEVLSDDPDLERLSPGAPNRAAVATNLKNSIKAFKQGFRRFASVTRDQRLSDWRDLVRLNIRHATEAQRHFTNGQGLVTVVEVAGGAYSLAAHSDLREFLNDVLPQPSMIPEHMAIVHSEDEQVRAAREWLSQYEEIAVAVSTEGHSEIMRWRSWGSAPAGHGYRRSGLVLSLKGRQVWTELNRWPGARLSPYVVVNTLGAVFPAARAETCGTCRHFAFSGMSRDMSGDWRGYCLHESMQSQARESPVRRNTVSVVDRCEHHDFVEDSEREHSYMAQTTT